MSQDFNQDQTQNAEATQGNGPTEPTTAKYARFLAGLARKRIDKLGAQILKEQELVAKYDALALHLPESSPSAASPAKARPQYDVGTTVSFRHGRTTATSTAQVLTGIIKARKDEDGKASAYKISVGEGFDETFYTVFPGSIVVQDVQEEQPAEGGNEPALGGL